VESAALWIILRRRTGGIDERRVLDGAARALVAALLMAGAAALFLRLLPDLAALLQVAGAVVIGGAVFWIAATVLGVEQARMLPRLVLRRLRG
jgi:hypothetical protein